MPHGSRRMQAAVEDCCAAHVEAVAGGVGAFSECGKRGAWGDGRDHLGMRCNGKACCGVVFDGYDHIFLIDEVAMAAAGGDAEIQRGRV